jgi:hypothetical protein
MVISVDVIADNEQQAIEKAREQADGMNLNSCAECVGHSECVTDTEALTAGELRRMENEKVQEFVSEYVEQQTPTEVHDIAEGYGVNWLEWTGDDETAFYNDLFHSISSCKHLRTAIFERYAKIYARRRWQEVAKEQAREWDEAFSKAKADPDGTRVIVETNEEDPSANCNPYGRYYMVDGSEAESCIEHAGQWVVIRVDTVTSPYEVHRPNYAAAHGYSDDQTQLACRCENPNNVTRWARLMIDAGRVTDIYADCY